MQHSLRRLLPTEQGPRSKEAMSELGIMEDGSLWIEDGIIQAVGTTAILKSNMQTAYMKRKLLMLRAILLPLGLSILIRMLFMEEVVNVNSRCG